MYSQSCRLPWECWTSESDCAALCSFRIHRKSLNLFHFRNLCALSLLQAISTCHFLVALWLFLHSYCSSRMKTTGVPRVHLHFHASSSWALSDCELVVGKKRCHSPAYKYSTFSVLVLTRWHLTDSSCRSSRPTSSNLYRVLLNNTCYWLQLVKGRASGTDPPLSHCFLRLQSDVAFCYKYLGSRASL